MKTIGKIYQNGLICDILNASGPGELKTNIQTFVSNLRSHNMSESQVTILFNDTLQELRLLNERRLPYDQHANIISAKNILKGLCLQKP